MADSIFVRVQRVVTGGVGTALDAAERLGGTSVMRQAIRDMDSAIDKARAEGESARARRLQAAHRLQECRKQLATLKDQARFALGKGRTDLAEAAIARQLDVEGQAASLAKAESEAAAAERRLEESAAELKLRRSQMYDELRGFEAAQRAASDGEGAPGSPDSRLQRRAERAQEAFERAMEAAGGLSGGRASPEAAAKVAELEALQKEAAIAERLAALQGGGSGAAPSAAAKRGRAKPGA
ncbi:MAG TPA: PspA/IM30 family protein [Allosphingosinicella sp.]|jgi:phage shock protein A|nr:PspA/IM30 family protein [Allosphingosinicella sp.]